MVMWARKPTILYSTWRGEEEKKEEEYYNNYSALKKGMYWRNQVGVCQFKAILYVICNQ